MDADVFVLYYDPQFHDPEEIGEMFSAMKREGFNKPVVVLPKDMDFKGYTRAEFLSLIEQIKEDALKSIPE